MPSNSDKLGEIHRLIRTEILNLLTNIVPPGGLKFKDEIMLEHEIDQTTETIISLLENKNHG